MNKASPNMNCSLCEKRKECWGENQQDKYLKQAVCSGYRYDNRLIGVYSNGKSS